MVPPTLFVDDMMDSLSREYYVALFSAAALHGAGHQQPMEFQIITKKPPLRNIKNQKLTISYFIKTNWQPDLIIKKKTETGYLNVSSPELTAFDLVLHHKKIGGLNRIIPILEDLTDMMKSSILVKTAKNQKTSNIQRLGFLLDELDKESFANSILKLSGYRPKYIPLSLAHKEQSGLVNEKWKVIINTELDI